MRLAINQPYFFPYAGYYRLFASCDIFVVLDCVQNIRRGWVHRQKLTTLSGTVDWLTLPLKKAPRDTTRIQDLEWADNAEAEWADRLARFRVKTSPLVSNLHGTPVEYITMTMDETAKRIGMRRQMIRSSTLPIDHTLRGQEKILAICSYLGATEYINAPGGLALYDEAAFAARGIELQFLPEYRGSYASMLERLSWEDVGDIATEIKINC